MFRAGLYQKRNDKGEIIRHNNVYNNIAQQIVDEFGLYEKDELFWILGSVFKSKYLLCADKQGFDIRAKKVGKQKYIIEIDKGKYPTCYKYRVTISQQYLGKGTELIRYGSPKGHYTALNGTKFEQLGLPYQQDTVEFHKYRVLLDIPVTCVEVNNFEEQQRLSEIWNGTRFPNRDSAVEGLVAPAFGSDGGAIQYYHDMQICDMLGTVLEIIQ